MRGRLAATLVLALLAAGCSRNYYGVEFQEVDSTGDARNFLVEWQATDMWLDFLPWKDDASPVALHTQGGERVIFFTDRKGAGPLGKCVASQGAAILFCGEKGQDVLGGVRLLERDLCGVVTTAQGAERIVDLGADISIDIGCTPRNPEKTIAGKIIDKDYLKARAQPYNLTVPKLTKAEYEALKARFLAGH